MLKVAASAAGLVLGAPALRVFAQTAALPSSVQRLGDDLFLVSLPGEANIVVQTGADGVVLVDGGSAGAYDALMKTVSSLPGGGPVRTIFNTHWHPEQTGGNERFGKAAAQIIAHENTRLWLATDVIWSWNGRRFTRVAKIAQPNKTFYDTGALPSGVRYGYIPDAAHTDGDLYVHFQKQNVLAVGDVVSSQGWPVVDYATGGWIGGIAGGLQRLQTLVDASTRIVPARGPVFGVAELKAQADMYGVIYDRLTQLLNKGRGPGEAVDAQPAKEFAAKMGNPDEFVRRSFESLWGYLSPDA